MSTSRRGFLRIAAIAGAGGITETAESSPTQRVSGEWLGMLTDFSLCVGCRKCEWACKDANGLPNQPIETYEDKSVFERERRTDAQNFTVVNRYPPAEPGGNPVDVKVQCMHCFEPACASACLVAAFRKTPEGPVVYNEDVCIGCRYCMIACPFSIPAYTYDDPYTPVVRKCTMCFERITRDGDIPACAKICPKEAITFGKRSDLITLARAKILHAPDKYVDHIYGEHEAGGTCWLYVSHKPFEETGFRDDIGTTAYPELTKGFLSAVPLVLVIWPALLAGSYAFTKRREELNRAEAPEEAPVQDNLLPAEKLDERTRTGADNPNPGVAVARTGTWGTWLTKQLFMGQSPGEYARGLITPFNLIALIILCIGIPLAWIRFTEGLASTTNLTDNYPWGLWIGFDVLCGVALAAGGYVLASAVYLFGLKDYRPLVRPAILTGFLGYFFVVVGLCFDLGRPWRLPYPMFVSFGVTSVMFLVGWHVALYLTVQFVEFCPTVFEWLGANKLRKWVMKLTIGATIFGVILSTLHQSALGALFLLAPGKVHPLWYSQFIPVFFFISSIAAGLSMVIVESMLSHRIFRTQVAGHDASHIDRLVLGLGKAAAVVLFSYFCLKWIGVAHGQHWGLLLTPYGYWFLLEVLGFVLLPCLLFGYAVRKQSAALVRFASVLSVLGIVLNRLNVSVITFQWDMPDRYFPRWTEFAVTITIIMLGLLTFRWMVNRMPVLRDHPAYATEH